MLGSFMETYLPSRKKQVPVYRQIFSSSVILLWSKPTIGMYFFKNNFPRTLGNGLNTHHQGFKGVLHVYWSLQSKFNLYLLFIQLPHPFGQELDKAAHFHRIPHLPHALCQWYKSKPYVTEFLMLETSGDAGYRC